MEQYNKRPIWVWIIVIWFILTGLIAIYSFYTIVSEKVALPEGTAHPEISLYYVLAFGVKLLLMLAATLLFLEKEVAKLLFAFLFVANTVLGSHTLLLGNMPEEYIIIAVVNLLTTLAGYSLITWYTFSLKNKGYYAESNT